MSNYKYKIGDFVKIIKPKHVYFGKVGRVLKISKSTLVITRDKDIDFITISKKYVKIDNTDKLINIPEMKMIPLTTEGKKKHGLDYYIKKAFLPEDFEDFILFNFMRVNTTKTIIVKGENLPLTRSELLTKKIKDRKIQSSTQHRSCIYFTAIPTKFFKKYYSEELIDRYQEEDTDVFICLDSKVLCNMPKNYWIGMNRYWSQGPLHLLWQHNYHNMFYAVDKCDTKLEMDKSFLEFFMEQLTYNLKTYFSMIELITGLILYLDETQEDNFITSIREQGAKMLMEMELFACPANWTNKQKTTIHFKKEDVLIANYEKDTVEENIKRVLGM
jgi:RNase P/RNase MRP subunit p29